MPLSRGKQTRPRSCPLAEFNDMPLFARLSAIIPRALLRAPLKAPGVFVVSKHNASGVFCYERFKTKNKHQTNHIFKFSKIFEHFRKHIIFEQKTNMKALRVFSAETWLTVYRRPLVIGHITRFGRTANPLCCSSHA